MEDEIEDDNLLEIIGLPKDSNSAQKFGSSLPKDIYPAFRVSTQGNLITHQGTEDDDLERIGKSFRDLSQSMATDGTELFGGLPSPRKLNAKLT